MSAKRTIRRNRCFYCLLALVFLPSLQIRAVEPVAPATQPVSPETKKTSKLQQRVDMSDEEWQVVKPVINRVATLSIQLRDIRDLKRALTGAKPSRSKVTADSSLSTVSDLESWRTELSDKAAAVRAAADDPNISPHEVEARLNEFRIARAKVEGELAAELEQARWELRQLVTARQELALTLSGFLD